MHIIAFIIGGIILAPDHPIVLLRLIQTRSIYKTRILRVEYNTCILISRYDVTPIGSRADSGSHYLFLNALTYIIGHFPVVLLILEFCIWTFLLSYRFFLLTICNRSADVFVQNEELIDDTPVNSKPFVF